MTQTPWFTSLRLQIVLLLSLALFPLGAVAVYQTNRVADEADRNAELALLAVTGRAAKTEELLHERAFGATRFFATIAEDFLNNPERCQRDLGRFVAANSSYSFVGILPLSGLMTCSSSNETIDFSGWPEFTNAIAQQQPTIIVNSDSRFSGRSVFVISEPFAIDGKFAGFIAISIPHSGIPDTPDDLTDLGLEELMTFNQAGDVLTARDELGHAVEELPATRALTDLSTGKAYSFSARNQSGARRTYTVVPIEGSPASVLGVWRVGDGLASNAAASVLPALFPLLMWVASIGVAMLSIYMLVLRHIAHLRRAMDAFTQTRHLDDGDTGSAMPNEIRALRDNFNRMTRDILQDEAALEDVVREKNVLVKEIHHRVKNNLQLISSIMNMQIRSAKEDETKAVISSLQDRVRSLATIHRDLYQSQHEGRVNAGGLLTEIIEKSFEIAVSKKGVVDLDTDIADVLLFPDQAVPLSLLAAEGTTNIMKYLGAPAGSKPWVRASLRLVEKDCELVLSNSVEAETSNRESTGLGSDLIAAFAIQLGGQITIEQAPGSYQMRVLFAVSDFVPDRRDF